MNSKGEPKGHYVDPDQLPEYFPTHLHDMQFWEHLGRLIATFGFLEETLGKAIFVLTATKEIDEKDFEVEYARWLETLNRLLSDPLGSLTDLFSKAVREHQQADKENLDHLVRQLRIAAKIRNALCHGSWRPPNSEGQSIPLYVTRKGNIFNTQVDIAYLKKTQKRTVEICCDVINSVTTMGWQFPGSSGPGQPTLKN
tara:strand:- start:13100 stop:13693 length:594 start_codon:yes stop_codon:yes gene_type:complete